MNRSWIIGIVFLGLLHSYHSSDGGNSQWVDSVHKQKLQNDPIQKPVTMKAHPHKEHMLQPLATFEITARVLSKTKYMFDREAAIAPYDLALGWGPMSQHMVVDTLKIWQDKRWYFYRYEGNPVIPNVEMGNHSANMHLIPDTDEIQNKIKKADRGDVIRIMGYLVNVTGEGDFTWQSSLTRTDTGDGACEVVWVKSFEILP